MERIFPNLYSFSDGPRGPTEKMSYTYLLVRDQGNLLVRHWGLSSVFDYIHEIDNLGGIDRQLIAHDHDAKRGDLHDQLFERFGCKLNYHLAERKAVRAKTKCPVQEFGDAGLQLDSDFQAHYFPGHTQGMSIFIWRDQGNCFLFPSHVIRIPSDEWIIQFDPELAPHLHEQFTELSHIHMDYLIPGASAGGREPIHQFTEGTRASLSVGISSILNPE